MVLELLIVAVVLAVVGAVGYRAYNANQRDQAATNVFEPKADTNSQPTADQSRYQLSGPLKDVTVGAVRGISTGGRGGGTAKAKFENGKYSLLATFSDLPDPKNGDFYEGWVVRRSPFKFISTGRAEKVGGVYSNSFRSDSDLRPFDLYVLTLEPNDGNPAPADHIVEGVMAPVQ